MDLISDFSKIAEFLMHPLVLVGFVMMMFFSIHKQLLKSGIIIPTSKKESSDIIKLLLRYGFWLGLLIILVGFGLQFANAGKDYKATTQNTQSNVIAGRDIINVQYGVPQHIIDRLMEDLDDKSVKLKERDALIQEWVKKYKDLERKLAKYSGSEVSEIKDLLANGKLDGAEHLFTQICVESNDYSDRIKWAAEARNIGDITTADQHEKIARTLPPECK